MPVQPPLEKRTILRDLIDERGIRYSFLAEKLGTTASSFTRLMNGEKELFASELLRLEELLGVPYETFFDGSALRPSRQGQADELDADGRGGAGIAAVSADAPRGVNEGER